MSFIYCLFCVSEVTTWCRFRSKVIITSFWSSVYGDICLWQTHLGVSNEYLSWCCVLASFRDEKSYHIPGRCRWRISMTTVWLVKLLFVCKYAAMMVSVEFWCSETCRTIHPQTISGDRPVFAEWLFLFVIMIVNVLSIGDPHHMHFDHFFTPPPFWPKGYCHHACLTICLSVCLSVCLSPSLC